MEQEFRRSRYVAAFPNLFRGSGSVGSALAGTAFAPALARTVVMFGLAAPGTQWFPQPDSLLTLA